MKELDQNQAPIYEALVKLRKKRIVPFDVPGHKRGRGNPELVELLGEKCVGIDVNSMKPLDNLGHPISIIRDAEELAADAFGASHAFLMIGGTTSSVQTMILATCKAGDKIILPRNVHKSAINALVLCGAIPIYIEMSVDPKIGIALGLEKDRVAQAIKDHPDAKAILINNPTYYGICSDLKGLTEMAHEAGMMVLVDEAHGAHLHFTDKLPISAMDAGADMAAVSMHKSGGSLTQSSILLIGEQMNSEYVRQIINLTQSTSASYLLMASLDISRRNLALRGKESFEKVIELSEYARREINAIGGYYAYSKELIDGVSVCDFDVTKLSVYTQGIGLTGIEVYDLLRDEYDIQIEFGDIGNILAYVSIGDRIQDIERLVGALADIKRLYSRDGKDLIAGEYIQPELVLSPQEAFYSERKSLTLDESVGQVCGEFVMCYPPGIPILAPGERITREIVDYIQFAKERGCSLQGTEDPEVNHINVIKRKYSGKMSSAPRSKFENYFKKRVH
ncbi:TPA: aminotransferase class I/II-fold pyridoxal phosphate-dependent enzyme [Streptococcus pneumoniae]